MKFFDRLVLNILRIASENKVRDVCVKQLLGEKIVSISIDEVNRVTTLRFTNGYSLTVIGANTVDIGNIHAVS